MRLCLFKFGNKAFIMTVMTSFILLMLLALMFFYSYSHKSLSSSFFESSAISSESFSFYKDMENVFQTNISKNATHYLIQESVFSGKANNISNRLSSYSLLLSRLSSLTNASFSFDFNALNYSNVNASAEGLTYLWDYNSLLLKINGSYSHLIFNFSGTATITDNCTNAGSLSLEINARDFFSKNLSSPCTINLNYSGNPLIINFDGNSFALNYSNAPSLVQSFLIRTNKTSSFKHYLNSFQTASLSTTNPGFTEPDYPAGANSVKYYGNISLYGNNYYLIVIDYNNDSFYDSVFISSSLNFTNAVLKTNSSQIFLNNRGFLITVSQSGSQVGFDNILSLHYVKEEDGKIISW